MIAPSRTKQSAAKSYRRAFLVDDRKLSRIAEIASERIQRMDSGTVVAAYTITFSDGKVLLLSDLEQVLALDNAVGNPIVLLDAEIFSSSGEQEATREAADYAVSVVFDNRSLLLKPSLAVYAWSTDFIWMTEAMGALEEQAERCIPRELGYALRRRPELIIVPGLLGLFGTVVGLLAWVDSRSPADLSSADLAALKTSASTAHTESEKIDVIFRYVLATVNRFKPQETLMGYFTNFHTYLVAVPIVAAIVLAIIAVMKFYPTGVFAWGDYGEYHARLVERRKIIWYGVLLALVVGVVSNLLVVGVSGFGSK